MSSVNWPAESGTLELGASDLESYERCPQQFAWAKARRRGTRIASRALERSKVLGGAITLAHRRSDPPTPDELKAIFEATKPGLVPADIEEREAILEMFDNYADIAIELGGEFIDANRDDDFLKRKSRRRDIVASSWEPLLFRHPGSAAEVIECRRVTSSRYRGTASADELHSEFRTHIRHLVVEAAFRGATVRVCEVNIADGTVAYVDRTPNQLSESAESIFRLEALIRQDAEFPPRHNYLCGTCQFMPACKAIPSMESPWG